MGARGDDGEMEYFEAIKKLVDGMSWDIKGLDFLKSGEPLVGVKMSRKEAEIVSLKHLKDSNILLMNEIVNIDKLNKKEDDEK